MSARVGAFEYRASCQSRSTRGSTEDIPDNPPAHGPRWTSISSPTMIRRRAGTQRQAASRRAVPPRRRNATPYSFSRHQSSPQNAKAHRHDSSQLPHHDRPVRIDQVRDCLGHGRERVRRQGRGATVAGKIGRDPGRLPQRGGEAVPHVTGGAETMQQQYRWRVRAATAYPQIPHSDSIAHRGTHAP